jgi:small GTP-binding protein
MLDSQEKLGFRVVAVGDASVGKTSIINRFLRDSFDTDEPSTIGALYDSFIQDCNGASVEIQLWDTAGQEQYRALGPVYFRGSDAAIVVFDLSNRESFRNVDEWVTSFRDVCTETSVVVIVGNKSDREDREIERDEAKQWAKSHSASYVETSAKTGEGVKVLFDELVSRLAPSLVAVGEAGSPRSIDLRNTLPLKKKCC